MPRFYIDTIANGELHLDPVGVEYPDLECAVRAATVAAAEFVADRIARGENSGNEEKVVRDEDGNIAAQFAVIDAFGAGFPH